MAIDPPAELLEQTVRAVYDARSPQDMHPGQWAVLRYMARVTAQKRTIAGVADHLGMTMGPASRAVSALARKKFLDVKPLETDRRKRVIRVTRSGRRLLENDPLLKLEAVLEAMPDGQRANLLAGLTFVKQQLSDGAQQALSDPAE